MITPVFPCDELLEALEDLELRAGIKRGRRLVKNQELRIAHVGPGDRQLLPLPS